MSTWQYGVYRPAINVFGVALNKFEWGGRVTALPVYEDDGRALVHVGFGTLNGELRPEHSSACVPARCSRNGPGYANPILVDTGNVDGSRQYTLAPELAAVYGSWTFQAEWTGQFLTRATPAGGTEPGDRAVPRRVRRGAVLPDRRAPALRQGGRGVRPGDAQPEPADEAGRRRQRVGCVAGRRRASATST